MLTHTYSHTHTHTHIFTHSLSLSLYFSLRAHGAGGRGGGGGAQQGLGDPAGTLQDVLSTRIRAEPSNWTLRDVDAVLDDIVA